MRNNTKSAKVISLIERLPVFDVRNLEATEIGRKYLRVFLFRKARIGEVVRLKRGFYTPRKIIEDFKNKGKYSDFVEFLAGKIYSHSYLSIDYILYQHNILTEIPKNFTLVTRKKTVIFSNKLGNFIYHKIKDSLFFGFEIVKKNDLIIYKASKAKALFDFLYLRKNLLFNKKICKELRLNLSELTEKDKKELKRYIQLEGSKAMKNIYFNLFGKNNL